MKKGHENFLFYLFLVMTFKLYFLLRLEETSNRAFFSMESDQIERLLKVVQLLRSFSTS